MASGFSYLVFWAVVCCVLAFFSLWLIVYVLSLFSNGIVSYFEKVYKEKADREYDSIVSSNKDLLEELEKHGIDIKRGDCIDRKYLFYDILEFALMAGKIQEIFANSKYFEVDIRHESYKGYCEMIIIVKRSHTWKYIKAGFHLVLKEKHQNLII